MDEGHLEAEHAPPGRLVDQLGAGGGQLRESTANVRDLVRDMVHPGAALREKAADRSVLAKRAQQFETALADADGGSLDPLLLDARAVLEVRSEQPLVGLERVVEVLHGEPDMVDRTGRLHTAMVCERLARMRPAIPVLLLSAAVLAGCGGSGKTSTTNASNGEASKPATQVLTDAKKAATSASSMHVAGHIVSGTTPITLDLSIARDKGAAGKMTTNGLGFDLIRIGDTVYIRGSDAFYQKFAGAAIAQLLHGKWLKASVTTGQLRSLAPLTNAAALFAQIASGHGKLANEGETTYSGQKVVAIKDTSDGSKLYVSATGTPYPVAIVGSKGRSGTITFDRWNETVSLNPPQSAIDISKLGAG
jgi:hypothetical protein